MYKLAPLSCLLVLAALPNREAAACSCLPPPPPQEAMAQSEAVFLGEVLQVQGGTEAAGTHGWQVTLRVQQRWKGPAEERVVIWTPQNEAACGISFQEGETYLVYAYASEGALHTNLCTRTKGAAYAAQDLEALGEGARGGTARRACGGPTNAGALQAVLFVLLGLAFGPRRARA